MSDFFTLRPFSRNCHGLAALLTFSCGFLVSAENAIPPSPDKPWSPPQLGDYQKQLAQGTLQYESNSLAVPVDSEKVYDLPDLIDLAERSHPQTRIAWEHARQAAGSVGLSESTYYPYLAASAAAGSTPLSSTCLRRCDMPWRSRAASDCLTASDACRCGDSR